MIKKALAVVLCAVIAAVLFASCNGEEIAEKDNALRAEIVGVWVPVTYDLTTNDPFAAVMFTQTKHFLYAFSGGEPGSRSVMIEEGTEYTVKNGNFVIETDTLNENGKMQQYRTPISFPDRDTMIWGTGSGAETYRRMTDNEIAFFTLPLGDKNPDYAIDQTHTSIPMTGGQTTTGGSGTNVFDNAVESSMKPFLDYYATWDEELMNETISDEVSQ